MNALTSQAARRGFRAAGLPRTLTPIVSHTMRELNRHIQWGNPVVWNRRWERVKEIGQAIRDQQTYESPVYRHRGLSKTASSQMSRNSPSLSRPRESKQTGIDKTTVVMATLGIMVSFSLIGPMIAKRAKWVDPLEVAEAKLDDPHGLVLK
jgi:hypothetical protein